ncbi:MAG: cytochrome P450 [Gammaproteobacteria bacterium]|jgi:cytochrome P450
MKLDDKTVTEIENGISSYIPPFPERSKTRRNFWELFQVYRRNLLEIFDDEDYQRSYARMKIFRRELILCNVPKLVQEAFQVQHEVFQQKTAQMEQALKPLIGDGLFISYGDLWKERRSAVAPIIHANKVEAFAPIMCETIQEWGENWSERKEGEELDVLFEMAELTAEIISRTVFGRKLGRQYTSEIVAGFKDYQSKVHQADLMSMIGFPDWFPRFYRGRIRKSLKRVHSVVDNIIEQHENNRSKNIESDAMIARLFEVKLENDKSLTRDAIRNEAIVIFMAGHETTANTLSWTWLNISQSPRVREKLFNELNEVLNGRPPSFEDIPRLKYTRYVIEETLRLYPPVPILSRRAIHNGVLNGETYKKGDILMISPWLLHRNPNVWSQPDSFIPERFDPDISPKPDKYSYIPFAIGPRICPGLSFGLTESTLAIAGLAQKFELRLKQGHHVKAVSRLTLRPGDKLPMTLHKKN